MIDNRCGGKHTVQRIADALGLDAAIFYSGSGELQTPHESLELLSAFERIRDVDDRRSCLEFVTAVAARKRPVEAR